MEPLVITESIQNWINHLKNTPGIVDVSFSHVPIDLLIPEVVTNPLLCTITLLRENNTDIGTARVVVPDSFYNGTPWNPVPLQQFKYIAEYNVTMNQDPGCLLCPIELIEWLHPETGVLTPLFGINHNPVDQTTLHPNLQSIVTQVRSLEKVQDVLLYEYIDPEYLKKFDSEQAYKMYVYFGENTGFDGNNNVAFAIRKETYEASESIPFIVDNVRQLLNDAFSKQGI